MRARWQVGVLALCASCDLYFDLGPADPPPDRAIDAGYTPPPYTPPTGPCQLGALTSTTRCIDGAASMVITNYYSGAGTHSMCSETLRNSTAQCAAGCAVEGNITVSGHAAFNEWQAPAANAKVLCAETPSAQLGQSCNTTGSMPCLPTHVVLAGDGTVASQPYLSCNTTTNTCMAATAPALPGYLAPCDDAVVAMYGDADVNGVTTSSGVCMLAWDEGAQRVAHGRTKQCLGDWQCPAGALCDDQLARLPASAPRLGVCKPGPRGVLTPEMLSP